jgi:hypothetical protein
MVFGFRKGGKIDISLRVDRPEGPFYPGDVVHADVELEVEKGMPVREVRAGLVFWERYQWVDRDSDGDLDRHWATDEVWVCKEILIPEGAIPDGFRQTYRFDWTIPPDAPPPYAGKISQTRWLAKVTVDRKLKRDVNEEVELGLIVPPPDPTTPPGEFGELSHPDDVHMQLRLPKLAFVEGETIHGRLLLVEPQKDFSAGEARVELVRGETVPREHGNRHVAVEGKVELARKPKFQAGMPVGYDFALPVPEQGCPTYRTDHSRVDWSIRAALSRRLRKDFTVEQEIAVYNGPARA